MRIVWVSPTGAQGHIASLLRQQGHAIVSYGTVIEGVPAIAKPLLAQTTRSADLVVVDSPFPVAKTRRSFKPSQDSLFFDEMRRKHKVVALGPTPTVDLLVGDARYLRKMCTRFGVPYDKQAEGPEWSSGAWFVPEPVPVGPYLGSFVPLFKCVGFRGWFCLHGVITEDGPVVQSADAVWASDTIPEGKEAEWLKAMVQRS